MGRESSCIPPANQKGLELSQTLIYSNIYSWSFSDDVDLQILEDRIDEILSEGAGWLVLNHPDEAGTQVRVRIGPGIPIVIDRKQGVAPMGDSRLLGTWVWQSDLRPLASDAKG
jgi:hypothetical protein